MKLEAISASLQRLPTRTRTVVISVVLGLVAGAVAVAFHVAIHVLYSHGIEALATKSQVTFLVGSLILLAGTSAASGWLLANFCPEAAGSGIPQVKVAFWKDFGFIPWRVVWVKFLGGALSVGGGSSLGREGPSVQLASGLVSNVAGVLGAPKHQRRTAAAAGAAAGLAAAFNTPIAAVTFVLEEIIGDLNSRMLGSVLLAAVLGALVAHGVLGAQPAFVLENHGAPGWLAYALTPLVALAGTLAGGWFQKFSMSMRAANKREQRLPAWVRTMLGGVAVWAIGAGVFVATGHLGVFSLGYDDLSAALNGRMLWWLALLLLVSKLTATAVCYSLGGCGGIFAPTLFFGGMAGAALSGLAGMVMPLAPADHVALALVGMCACLGAVVRAPVTGILIVFEMTHEFGLVPLLMIGALISQTIARRMSHENFYEEVLAQDGQHVTRLVPPRSLRTWMEVPVSRIANFAPVVATSLDAPAVRTLLGGRALTRFPVVIDGRLTGVLERREAEAALAAGRAPRLEAAASCLADTPLREVQAKLIEAPNHFMVVVDRLGDEGRAIGVLTLHDILRAEMLFAREEET